MQARTNHPLYFTWRNMKYRVLNPKYRQWHRYGGRGITICSRWLNPAEGFWKFVEDMGPKPNDGQAYSIDRINNDGDYTPENCRWATIKQQSLNRVRHGSSRYRGVIKAGMRWRTTIRANGKTQHVGTFDDEKLAARAFDDVARVLYGQDASLNFPPEAGE